MKIRTGYQGRDDRGRLIGPTWTENVPTLDLATYPQTPLERRVLTPEELAQRAAVDAERSRRVLPAPRPAPRAIPVDAATLRHSVRVTDPAPSGNLAEPTQAPTPIPVTPVIALEEEQAVTVIATIAPEESDLPDLPCASCIHRPICRLEPRVAEAMYAISRVATAGDPAVRIRSTVECDHYAASPNLMAIPDPAGNEPVRREHGGESWRTPAPTDAERMAASRNRGNARMLEEKAKAGTITVRPASLEELAAPSTRHPSKKAEAAEKAERARRVLDAVARNGGDRAAAAAELGMRVNAVAMVLKFAGSRLGESQAVAS